MINLLIIPLICAFYGSPCIESVETQEKPVAQLNYNDTTSDYIFNWSDLANETFYNWALARCPSPYTRYDFVQSNVYPLGYASTFSVDYLYRLSNNSVYLYTTAVAQGSTAHYQYYYQYDSTSNSYSYYNNNSSTSLGYTGFKVHYIQGQDEEFYRNIRTLYNALLEYNNNQYQEGYDVGYNTGFTNGKQYGSQTGYDNGYLEGLLDGKGQGYQDGYADGLQAGADYDETALTIFSGILEVGMLPINFFLAILNYEIFGINISGLVGAIMTITIVIILIRLITGGEKKE